MYFPRTRTSWTIYLFKGRLRQNGGERDNRRDKKELDNLTIIFSIDCCCRERGCPSTKHCNVVLNQKYPQTLPQVGDDLLVKLAHISGQLPAQLGDDVEGRGVPAPKGVHCYWQEGEDRSKRQVENSSQDKHGYEYVNICQRESKKQSR